MARMGTIPTRSLVLDKTGTLYGTSAGGGSRYGTVVKIGP